MIQVLIVEDDPMVAELNRQYVESVPGFRVIGMAANGEQAMSFCQKNKVHLIILDIYMPKFNGIEFLETLRREFILIDVIMVTASREADSVGIALKLGAIDYLIKPFEYDRMKETLENYLKRIELLSSSEQLYQNSLDEIIIRGRGESPLAKGLHKSTLRRIKQYLEGKGGIVHRSESIADHIGVSKVTVRRYMEYLQSVGDVAIEINYGEIGRPSYLYRYMRN